MSIDPETKKMMENILQIFERRVRWNKERKREGMQVPTRLTPNFFYMQFPQPEGQVDKALELGVELGVLGREVGVGGEKYYFLPPEAEEEEGEIGDVYAMSIFDKKAPQKAQTPKPEAKEGYEGAPEEEFPEEEEDEELEEVITFPKERETAPTTAVAATAVEEAPSEAGLVVVRKVSFSVSFTVRGEADAFDILSHIKNFLQGMGLNPENVEVSITAA